jgi:two-component system sensor histidine kinase NreB
VVRISQKGDFLLIVVSDEGCGISAVATGEHAGFGVRGMEARARLLGGSFAIESGSSGTRVVARLPLTMEA